MKKSFIFPLTFFILLIGYFLFQSSGTKQINEPIISPISQEDLQQGLQCFPLMTTYISNGMNSEDYKEIYGGVMTPSSDEVFLLNLEDNYLIKTKPSIEENSYGHKITYKITASDVEGVNIESMSGEEEGNKYSEYLFLRSSQYRFFRSSTREGNEMLIRGFCESTE